MCGLLEHPFRGTRGDLPPAPALGAACGTVALEVRVGELCSALTECAGHRSMRSRCGSSLPLRAAPRDGYCSSRGEDAEAEGR